MRALRRGFNSTNSPVTVDDEVHHPSLSPFSRSRTRMWRSRASSALESRWIHSGQTMQRSSPEWCGRLFKHWIGREPV